MIIGRIKNWFSTHDVLSKLFKNILLFGIFGFIPGAWLFGVPLIFLYGLYKKETIARALVHSVRRISAFWQDMSAEVGAYLSNQIANHPIKVIKFLTSLFLFATMSMPFCFLGIYGLYRFTTDEWQAAFGRFWDRATRFFTVGVANTIARMSAPKKLIWGTLICVGLALFAQSGGPFFIVDLGFIAAQYALVYVGFTAFFRDARTWLSKPISNVSVNFGKVLGTLWGRWLAYETFTGTITGSLGPAIGQVRTQGVVSALIPAFLSPRNGWFALNSGYFSILMSRITTFFNSVISGLFFSHNMRLWGDFQGYIGPNSFQIFTLMIIGGLIGYGAEKFVDALYRTLKNDGLEIMEAATPHVEATKNQAYQFRWHLAYSAIATPVILASPGGAQIFALAGGSILGAAALTASAVGLALAGVYGAGYAIKNLYRRIMPVDVAAPDRALPALQAAVVPSLIREEEELHLSPTPPAITPAFAAVLEAADAPVSSSVEPLLLEGENPELRAASPNL